MKKLLSVALLLGSVGFVATSAEAKPASPAASPTAYVAASAAPQWNGQWRNRRRWDRRARVTTQTRLVRVGRRVFRETYQVRYLPNGMTQTRLISRVRVR
jgi:hypothetical protein